MPHALPTSATLTPALARAPRSLPLDILRGIAILLVIGRHYVVNARTAGFLMPIAGVWQRFGWTGVDLFFVLSGFLVGGLLCTEARDRGHIDVKRFIIRRGFKIWPLYYLYLAFLAGTAFLGYPKVGYDFPTPAYPQTGFITPDEAQAPLWPSLLHFQNYYRVIDVNQRSIPAMPRSHLWSLAVEEHFYLILPFLLVLLLLLQPTRRFFLLPWIALGTMIACTLARCFTYNLVPFPWGTHVYPTHMRIDGLFCGVLLAYLYHFKPGFMRLVARFRWPLFVLGIMLVAPMFYVQIDPKEWDRATGFSMVPAYGFTMLYVGYGCILLAMLSFSFKWMEQPTGLRRPIVLFLRTIGWVGLFSYPIYLWHIDLGRFPMQYLLETGIFKRLPAELGWLIPTACYVTLAVGTGAILGRLFEKPALLLRDRLFPARAAALNPLVAGPTPPAHPATEKIPQNLPPAPVVLTSETA